MSTRGTVYVAINGLQAGVTDAAEAKDAILSHIGKLISTLAQDVPVADLEQLGQIYGLEFEVKAGKVSSVTLG